MREPISDVTRLQHMVDVILEIEQYVSSSMFEDFQNNSMLRYACVKQLEIIGEAAIQLSKRFKNLTLKLNGRILFGSGLYLFTSTSLLTLKQFGKPYNMIYPS